MRNYEVMWPHTQSILMWDWDLNRGKEGTSCLNSWSFFLGVKSSPLADPRAPGFSLSQQETFGKVPISSGYRLDSAESWREGHKYVLKICHSQQECTCICKSYKCVPYKEEARAVRFRHHPQVKKGRLEVWGSEAVGRDELWKREK